MSKDWPQVKLGEVLEKVMRPVNVSPNCEYGLLGVRLAGRGAFLRETKMGGQISAKTLCEVRRDDFIYSRLFAWQGAFDAIADELDGTYVSNEFPLFNADPARLDLQFLKYWFRLSHILRRVEADCTGSTPQTRNRFKEVFFEALECPLPPLAEQRRIVAKIESLAGRIEEARRLHYGALENAVSLASAGLERVIPKSCPREKLRHVVAADTKISYGVLVPGPDIADGVPFVRVQDLHPRTPPSTPAKHISPEIEQKYLRTRLQGGEVLVAVVGSIGKIGLTPASWKGANVARAVCRIVPGPRVEQRYLVAALLSRDVQAYFHETTRTLAQPTLNVSQLSEVTIPVPPLDEQRRIVARLDALQFKVDELKSHQAKVGAELDALLPSILDKAFKGEL